MNQNAGLRAELHKEQIAKEISPNKRNLYIFFYYYNHHTNFFHYFYYKLSNSFI